MREGGNNGALLLGLLGVFFSLFCVCFCFEGEEDYDVLLNGHECGCVLGYIKAQLVKRGRGARNTSIVPLSLKTKIPKLLTYLNKPNNCFNFLKSK